jgi:translation initiation factor 5
MRHKLTTFIVKNPPPPPNDKYTKKKKENDAIANGKSDEDKDDDSEADEALTKRIQEEAAQLPHKNGNGVNGDDDDDWAEDTSEEAQAARMRELQEGLNAKLVLGEDDDDEDEDGNGSGGKYEKFGSWLEENADTATDADVVDKAAELGLVGKHRLVQVIVQVVFDDKVAQQVKKRVPLLRKFVTNEKAQKSLLGGFERLVGLNHRSAMPKIPAVLKALYDADLVDEAVVLKWGSKPSKRYVSKDVSKEVKKAAEPFLKWLQEAEEESSEESD